MNKIKNMFSIMLTIFSIGVLSENIHASQPICKHHGGPCNPKPLPCPALDNRVCEPVEPSAAPNQNSTHPPKRRHMGPLCQYCGAQCPRPWEDKRICPKRDSGKVCCPPPHPDGWGECRYCGNKNSPDIKCSKRSDGGYCQPKHIGPPPPPCQYCNQPCPPPHQQRKCTSLKANGGNCRPLPPPSGRHMGPPPDRKNWKAKFDQKFKEKAVQIETTVKDYNQGNGLYTWTNQPKFANSLNVLVEIMHDKAKNPQLKVTLDDFIKYGLSELTEENRNYLVCASAARYLFEENITIEQAADKGFQKVKEKFGGISIDRKNDAIIYLNMSQAKNYCKYNNWKK